MVLKKRIPECFGKHAVVFQDRIYYCKSLNELCMQRGLRLNCIEECVKKGKTKVDVINQSISQTFENEEN